MNEKLADFVEAEKVRLVRSTISGREKELHRSTFIAEREDGGGDVEI
jgi:hypothetical protein